MANNHSTLTGLFTDIADAIRVKTGGTESIVADAFPEAISMIETGGGTDVEDALVTRTLTEYSNDRVTRVGKYAFYSASLTSVNLPAATYIDEFAFGNASLISVNLPAATYIAKSAFVGCNSLTSVNLPAATIIGVSAFARCKALTNVNVPVAKSIASYAFINCSALPSINLPKATRIGNHAFSMCSRLMTLTLGASTVCTLGGADAFYSTPMSVSKFTGTFGSIYVPASLLASYQTASNWRYFSSRFVPIGSGGIDHDRPEE